MPTQLHSRREQKRPNSTDEDDLDRIQREWYRVRLSWEQQHQEFLAAEAGRLALEAALEEAAEEDPDDDWWDEEEDWDGSVFLSETEAAVLRAHDARIAPSSTLMSECLTSATLEGIDDVLDDLDDDLLDEEAAMWISNFILEGGE